MEVPGSIYLDCPRCGEEALHQVLKGTAGKNAINATVECGSCGHVYKHIIKGEKKKALRVIVSHKETSFKDAVEFPLQEVLSVGDVFYYKEYDVRITGIETEKGRVGKAGVKKINTLWVMRFDFVEVPVSIKQGERTKSFKIKCDPGDDFEVGQEMLVEGVAYIIEKIRIQQMTVKKPKRGAFAYDIKRIYLKNPPIVEKKGRSKRGRPGR